MTYYTAGEFAKKAGVTARTLRHYDAEGLLRPSARSESGYRLYADEDMITLQRIIALRYLRFSLPQIQAVLSGDQQLTIKQSIAQQKAEFLKEREHLDQIIGALEKLENQETCSWEDMTGLIQLINSDTFVQTVFHKIDRRRVNQILYEAFGYNAEKWNWFKFHQMSIKPGDHILEVDCTDGAFWMDIASELPPDLTITCTSMDDAMLEALKANLAEITWPQGTRFIFERYPSGGLHLPAEAYDTVIATHLFIRSAELDATLEECRHALKPGGFFYCTAIAPQHMHELYELIHEFEPKVHFYNMDSIPYFNKETVGPLLSAYFEDVNWVQYDTHLEVNDAELLLNFIWNTYSNIIELLQDRKQKFFTFLQQQIKKRGKIYISEDTGICMARKTI